MRKEQCKQGAMRDQRAFMLVGTWITKKKNAKHIVDNRRKKNVGKQVMEKKRKSFNRSKWSVYSG